MFGCNQGWMYDGSGWMIFGWLWMVFLMLVPVLLLVALVKYVFGGSHARENPKRMALDTLNETYARGGMPREEYLQKREDLRKS